MNLRGIGISGRMGLALLVAWPSLALGLCVNRARVELVAAVVLCGLLPALLGGIAWLRGGQRRHRVYQEKRLFTLLCLGAALLAPLLALR